MYYISNKTNLGKNKYRKTDTEKIDTEKYFSNFSVIFNNHYIQGFFVNLHIDLKGLKDHFWQKPKRPS